MHLIRISGLCAFSLLCSCASHVHINKEEKNKNRNSSSLVAMTEEVSQATYVVPTDRRIIEYVDARLADYEDRNIRSRNTRKLSNSLTKGIAAVTTASSGLGISTTAVSYMNVGSTAIKGAQDVNKADRRANAFLTGAWAIERARTEYLSRSAGTVSGSEMTEYGVALYQRVKAIEHLVESTLSGTIATVAELDAAVAPLGTQ